MSISWSDSIEGFDWEALSALYRAAPLGNKSPAWLQTAFGNSRIRCFAHDAGRLVGAGRALADGVDCAYVCDIAVLPSHQGSGLGKELVTRLLERARGHRKIILYAVPGKEAFYRGLGFRRMRTAMAIFENQTLALEQGYVDET